jgi:hypothetical protein
MELAGLVIDEVCIDNRNVNAKALPSICSCDRQALCRFIIDRIT